MRGVKLFLTRLTSVLVLVLLVSITINSQNISATSDKKSATINGYTYNIFDVNKESYTGFATYYYPTSSSNKPFLDAKGRPINTSQPTCLAPQGFPYGTKLRVFYKDKKDQKSIFCVINGYHQEMSGEQVSSESGSSTTNMIYVDILSASVDDVNQFGSKEVTINIVSFGDDETLDLIDNGRAKEVGNVVETKSIFDDAIKKKNEEEAYLIKNNIKYYNPKEHCDVSGDQLSGIGGLGNDPTEEQRAEYVLRFLTAVGFTLNQAAGIVGNMHGESGVRPYRIEEAASECAKNSPNDNKPDANGKYQCEIPFMFQGGVGLIQWTGWNHVSKLMELAEKRGKSYFDMDVQLEYLIPYLITIKKGLFTGPQQLANKVPNVPIHLAKTVEEAGFAFLDAAVAPGATNCGYGCYLGTRSCKGKCKLSDGKATADSAEKTYQRYKEIRIGWGNYIADMFRGKIPDGKGVTLESLEEMTKNEKFYQILGGNSETNNGEMCETDDKPVDRLLNLIKDVAWPLHCHRNQTRDENGLSCKANQGRNAYIDLIDCRKHKINNGTCLNKNGYIGHIGAPGGNSGAGQDCGGFVTTVIQESEYDENYNRRADGYGGVTSDQQIYLSTSPNWKKVASYKDNINTAKLKPGDVAICVRKIDGCPSSGHTFIYTGELEGFEFPAASASLLERYPMAGQEILNAGAYNWYRLVPEAGTRDGSDEEYINVPLPDRYGPTGLEEYEYIGGSQERVEKFANNLKREGITQGQTSRCLMFAQYYAGKFCLGQMSGFDWQHAHDAVTGGCRFSSHCFETKAEYFEAMFEHLEADRPVVIQVDGSKNASGKATGRHFVAVVGYRQGVTAETILETDLLMLDPAPHGHILGTMDAPWSRFLFNDQSRACAGYRFDEVTCKNSTVCNFN